MSSFNDIMSFGLDIGDWINVKRDFGGGRWARVIILFVISFLVLVTASSVNTPELCSASGAPRRFFALEATPHGLGR